MALSIERPEQQEHAEDKTKIADAVDDKSLVTRPRIGVILIPESDQRVRAQPDALPTRTHNRHAVAEHQGEHGSREKIQYGKEPPEGVVVMHIADGIDMDQTADAGDDKNHHRRKRID